MKKEEEITPRMVGKIILGVVGIVLLITVIFGAWYTVGAGERAVILTFGKASELAYEPGLHFKAPIVQKAVKMDVKTQKYETGAKAASKDLQTVSTEVTVNYHIRPESVPNIYKSIGLDYQSKMIQPAVQEVVKAATAQFTAEELISKRPEVKDKIDAALDERLSVYNILIDEVSMTDFEFSESFNTAIEAKVTAEQNALAAKNKLAQVEYEKQQRITQAQGEAEAIKIQAQAIQAQGGKDYVQLQAISKWDGKLPQITGGVVPFVDASIKSDQTN